MTGDHKATACHKMRYPYAVYYSHTQRFKWFRPLVGGDGTKVEAVTSSMPPEHFSSEAGAYEVLKIKPGPAGILSLSHLGSSKGSRHDDSMII
uniref:BURP domain-containing protein n=1 Tax=Salix viminalis TaxID=40686 RepID=A0A6N2L273_SALVM